MFSAYATPYASGMGIDPKFLHSMGVASIIAGLVLLLLAQAAGRLG